MVDFFTGLFSCACFFAVCYVLALIIETWKVRLKYKSFSSENPPRRENAPADESSEKNLSRQPAEPITRLYKIVTPRKRKARKSNVISLKGALMPEGTAVSYNGKLYTAKPSANKSRRKTQAETKNSTARQKLERAAKTERAAKSSADSSGRIRTEPIKTRPKKIRTAVVSKKRAE